MSEDCVEESYKKYVYESTKKYIKILNKHSNTNHIRAYKSDDPGRNSPCVCGSKKKFKNCCWWITNQMPSGKFTDLAIKIYNKTARYIRNKVYLKRQEELYGKVKTK